MVIKGSRKFLPTVILALGFSLFSIVLFNVLSNLAAPGTPYYDCKDVLVPISDDILFRLIMVESIISFVLIIGGLFLAMIAVYKKKKIWVNILIFIAIYLVSLIGFVPLGAQLMYSTNQYWVADIYNYCDKQYWNFPL